MHRTRLVLRLSYALALVACGLLALRAFRGQSVPDQLAPDDGQHASPYPPLPDFGELALFKPASADQAGGGHALQAPSCDVCPPTDAICRSLGEHNLARSVPTRGSGLRLRRFLQKLTSGQPVTVAVLGGSVSDGHGLFIAKEVMQHDKLIYGRLLFDQLTKKYPHPDHKFYNGASPGKGSAYFKYCFSKHLPPDPDLIFTEHNINDVRNTNAIETYEKLLRSLLVLPSQPAIVNVHAVALFSKSMIMGGDTALSIAAFYDVPTISLPMVLLPHFIANPESKDSFFSHVKGDAVWGFDGRHMNSNGHLLLSYLIRIFLEREICKLQAAPPAAPAAAVGAGQDALLPVPAVEDFDEVSRLAFTGRFNDDLSVHDRTTEWVCLSSSLKPNSLVPTTTDGWDANWSDPKAASPKVFLYANSPGASFSFLTGPLKEGTVAFGYLSSAFVPMGNVRCSLERTDVGKDEYDPIEDVVLYGSHVQKLPLPITVSHNDLLWELAGAGDYNLTCVLLRPPDLKGALDFRIFSLTYA